MKLLDKSQVIKFVKKSQVEEKNLILIPTMGNLHFGHEKLVEAGRSVVLKNSEKNKNTTKDLNTVVSIFVNRSQFNSSEDYSNYTRVIDSDLQRLKKLDVDAVFIPEEEDFFPKNVKTMVSLFGDIVASLCAKYRDNHFNGVATVVTKLLNLIQPDIAVFGLKDFQQWLIINKIVKDLNIKTTLVGVPTIRSENNTALSSRLSRLSANDRQKADSLFPEIKEAMLEYNNGSRSIKSILDTVRKNLKPHIDSVEYLEFRDSENLSLITSTGSKNARLFIAVYIGKIRLIDNVAVTEDKVEINSYY